MVRFSLSRLREERQRVVATKRGCRRRSVTPLRPATRSTLPLREGDSPSHRRHVLAVLDRQQDAGPIIEARTILFGPVVHALARGNFTLADERLTDRFAEFASAGFAVVSAAGTMRLRISKAS